MRCAATASSAAFRRGPRAPACAQRLLGVARGQPLVDERGGDRRSGPRSRCAKRRASRLTACSRAVGVRRQPDDEQRRPPLGDRALDGGEAERGSPRAAMVASGCAMRGLEVADGDADAFGAEVERENGARSRVRGDGRWVRGGFRALRRQLVTHHSSRVTGFQACPASSDRLAKSMPSRLIAAGRRSSAGSSKITSALACTVSQAFCASSCSS